MIYEKGPQTLSEVIRIVEKFTAAQVTATLKPSLVSMMSNDERCFVCGQTGHFGHPLPWCTVLQLQWIQPLCTRLPNNIPSSGTPCNQDRSHSRQQYTQSQRDRSQSTHYRHRHERHFNKSHCWSHHDRSSSSYRRDILCSPSSHHSGLNYPLADRCSHHHSCQDTPHRHSHIPSQTCHFSHWYHSCHSINFHCTAWRPQPVKKVKHTQGLPSPMKPTNPRPSSFRTPY